MSKIKIFLLILILVIGVTSLGCLGKKTGEIKPPSQPTVTPAQTVSTGISDTDLNTMESDMNYMDSLMNDSGSADTLELNVEI